MRYQLIVKHKRCVSVMLLSHGLNVQTGPKYNQVRRTKEPEHEINDVFEL